MKKISSLIVGGLLVLILLTAAAPATPWQATPNAAAPALIRLTIDNRDPGLLSLRLINDSAVYNLKVPGHTRSTFTIKPGSYSYKLSGCGISMYGTTILTMNTIMVNPVCGGSAHIATKTGKIDLSKLLKVARIEIVNELGVKVQLYFKGPTEYVLTLPKNADKEYTLAKGVYKVQYYACGQFINRKFEAYPGNVLTLSCQ